MPPLVPGFTITSALSSDAKGSTWAAMRTLDDKPLVLKVIPVSDVTEARAKAVQLMAVLDGIENEHLVGQHGAIALADGELALVLDRVTGGSLARLLGERGNLSPGETVTTLAPLFGALAALHASGVEHGDLAPRSILFSADGRPLIGDVGVARLMGHAGGQVDRDESLMAPEVAAGAVPSAASDVYSMAAIGWLCLTGAPPDPASTIRCSTTVSPRIPALLTDVLNSCLTANPTARPSARAAAIEVFDAVQAESVVLTSVADPATEITRRIRATAAAVSVPAPPSAGKHLRGSLVIGAIALLVMMAIGGGTMWFVSRSPEPARPAAARSLAQVRPSPAATATSSTTSGLATADLVPATPTSGSLTDVVTARESPRIAAAGLLQSLVDARALAYAARNPALLDLVYAPGATRADADRSNLGTALERGATYLELRFVVKDAVYLDGTSDTARVRATIVTPAYETGQPDGRRVVHPQETVGPSIFTLSLTRDGWRILALALP
ncbi:MAG TPA: protein kinase [Dermatophilaceae bacterium]|nr:protein kinase [Dermatophilaceae bacterium]